MIKKRFKWNYDACYEVAKGCNKIIEFKKKNQVAYNVARKEGWIKDYNWFIPTEELRHAPRPNRKKWTFEKCFELAKTCNTLAELEGYSHSAICSVANNKRKSHGGYKWMYLSDYESLVNQ